MMNGMRIMFMGMQNMDRGVKMPKINQEEYEKIKLLPYYDWNWIARERTGKILGFTNKPIKTDEVWKDKQTRLWFNYKDSQLFRFIQWEDEEPYEIAELIREYEIKELRLAPSGTVIVDSFDESEETEVKDIEELKSWFEDDKLYVGKYVKHKINQLDEPEVLSQKWIDENKEARINNLRKRTTSDVVTVEKLQNLLFSKQELPVIPRYVGEFIEEAKGSGYKLGDAFSILTEIYHQSEAADWLAKEKRNSEIFARAWLDGYTVEAEPLYYAMIKGHELLADHDALSFTYWNFNMSNGYLLHGNKFSKQVRFLTKMTKEDWNKLGINDSNADFKEVDEDD